MDILTALSRGRLFFDGAMGTMLQAAGLPQGKLPDLWCLENPTAVKNIHSAYLSAGCNILKSNTFGANPHKLMFQGVSCGELVSAGVCIARQAIAESQRENCFVALDIGPTGQLLKPVGDLDFEDCVSLFAEMVKAGAAAGADCVLIETMSDTYELKAAVLAAKENAPELPIFATMIFDQRGKLLTGGDIAAATALLEGLSITAFGFNCGMGPAEMAPLVAELSALSSSPIILNPNAGLPRCEAGSTFFDVSPKAFAAEMSKIAPQALMLGGCCGTTPEHLRAMIFACKNLPYTPPTFKETLMISSYGQAVSFVGHPIIIGERINPTGKKLLQQALRDNDLDYILRQGLSQQDAGAHILDVNVGLPGLDEPALLEQTVKALQSVTTLPLQLDSSDFSAMERAVRCYNGKALLNSVSGKQESLDAILPLVKKYGGGLVCLCLDHRGIPETAQGRLEVARRIVEEAEKYGIPRRDLLVDVLTLPVSADDRNSSVTLEALALVKTQLGVKTVLGVSNVSFGLPQRERVSSAFFTLALARGLDGAIINPNSDAMMSAYSSFNVLSGGDKSCLAYIDRFGGQSPASAGGSETENMDLKTAILKGLSKKAAELAKSLATSGNILDIIQGEMVPALDQVGLGFEAGTVFLPQLLMSAQAAKAAFQELKQYLPTGENNGPKIILATVKGDIHDIGKNIVKVLLENYRFKVIDLGKDVSPQAIVEAALREEALLVGLSALMTTTAPYMAETILQLRAAKPDCRVMVGGAVITQKYADSIGADCYSSDAMGSVRYAQKLFGA